MAPLAGAFGGLLASGILHLPGIGNIPDGSWRLIFVIEGIITVGIGLVALIFLTDRPETAKWLSQAEKDLVIARVKSERVAVTHALDKPDAKKLWSGLANPVTAITGLIFLFGTVTVQYVLHSSYWLNFPHHSESPGYYVGSAQPGKLHSTSYEYKTDMFCVTRGLVFFAPTIVRSIYPEATVTQQQLYTVPPYTVGAICLLAVCLTSWKTDKRRKYYINIELSLYSHSSDRKTIVCPSREPKLHYSGLVENIVRLTFWCDQTYTYFCVLLPS